MSRVIALVPAKSLLASKSRLAPVLLPATRVALAARLLNHVLTVLHQCDRIDAIWVVGGDQEIAAIAGRHSTHWQPEPGRDLNDSLWRVLQHIPDDITAALILPMDLPFLTAEAVSALIAHGEAAAADVVIAPDRWGQGTNALLLRRPFLLRPAFGPHSLHHHTATGRALGLRVICHFALELAFDLDTPTDLADAENVLLPTSVLPGTRMTREDP